MVEISSPLSFLRIVVFPALSRPLFTERQSPLSKVPVPKQDNLQEENAHLLFFPPVLPDYRQEAHIWQLRS